ncbi:MAG: hypothetical protein KJ941_06560 [Bacteroidetes bacterium]|nr:hypothetical protein [Bacteroidota bacterium]
MKKVLYALLIFSGNVISQNASETFYSTRIINAHSNEMLGDKVWQYRIEHRFGDMLGDAGGATAGFGFDNAADIRFAFEHGLTDNITVGFGRNKGVGGIYPSSLLEGLVKVRLLHQNKEKKIPVSITVAQESYYSYMKASPNVQSIANFPEASHRLMYGTQMTIARKINDRASAALIPSYTHRNYVLPFEKNGLFSLGAALNLKVTKSFSLLAEYFYAFEDAEIKPIETNSMALGMEWNTNGHNFRICLTNARGFGTVQYLAENDSRIADGQLRMGFSITRDFKIRRRK